MIKAELKRCILLLLLLLLLLLFDFVAHRRQSVMLPIVLLFTADLQIYAKMVKLWSKFIYSLAEIFSLRNILLSLIDTTWQPLESFYIQLYFTIVYGSTT